MRDTNVYIYKLYDSVFYVHTWDAGENFVGFTVPRILGGIGNYAALIGFVIE